MCRLDNNGERSNWKVQRNKRVALCGFFETGDKKTASGFAGDAKSLRH